MTMRHPIVRLAEEPGRDRKSLSITVGAGRDDSDRGNLPDGRIFAATSLGMGPTDWPPLVAAAAGTGTARFLSATEPRIVPSNHRPVALWPCGPVERVRKMRLDTADAEHYVCLRENPLMWTKATVLTFAPPGTLSGDLGEISIASTALLLPICHDLLEFCEVTRWMDKKS
jgi:hypothetical protein